MSESSIIVLLCTFLVAGCQSGGKDGSARVDQKAPPAQLGTSGIAGAGGRVVETMNTGGYTYVRIDTGKGAVWAAGPEFEVKVGDDVVVQDAMPMENYHSSTLDRDFDVVYFCSAIAVAGAEASTPTGGMPPGHPPLGQAGGPSKKLAAGDVDLSGIARAPGGYTVAEVFAKKAGLGGREIAVRGRVVKANFGILGTNWFHLRDGSGGEGTNDLTITTDAEVGVGDLVLVRGAVTLDKDFGAGYRYDLIVEKAAVTKE